MREIKFRAWDEGNKVMHFDFEFIRSGVEGNDWILFTSDKHKLGSDPDPLKNPYLSQQLKIMEHTGLKDSKGVDIVEGDVVRFDGEEWGDDKDNKWAVEWNDKDGCWQTGGGTNSECEEWKEVIGNIYENPELLEAK